MKGIIWVDFHLSLIELFVSKWSWSPSDSLFISLGCINLVLFIFHEFQSALVESSLLLSLGWGSSTGYLSSGAGSRSISPSIMVFMVMLVVMSRSGIDLSIIEVIKELTIAGAGKLEFDCFSI